ncbi:MAG: T9SS type A sorting domain-containing protein [Bacteroidetes bacterium]|nr:T9SS type A sorting domain-containing protein [Bacteroidota bacterium]
MAIPQTVSYHSTNPFGNFQLSVDSQGHLHVLFHELNEFKYTRLIESTTRFYSPKTIVTGYFPFFAQDKSPYFYAAIQSDQSFKLTYLTPSEIKLVSFIPVFDLVVDQKLADGISSFGEVAQVLDGDVLDWETAPHTFLVKKGINGRFQSSSSLAASNTQKYYEWTNRKAWHNRLEFQPTDNEQIESQFKQIDGSGLLSAISDGMVMNNLSGISFSDPWFEKNGLSKGTQAILEPVSIPFDLSINGPRKGVFLNQVKPNPGEIRPYYSIRSENVVQWSGHEFAFQSWTTVGAQLTETQSGEQPIVFTAPNATVTATYKAMMSSRLPNWVQNQAQYSGNGKSAVVYKSETNGFGGVWLHTEKNGQKYETGDYSTDYELGSPLSVASTDYNHLKQYFAMFNVVSTVPGDYLLDIVEVTNGVITQSRRMANIPALPANLSPSTKVYISGHNPINSSEWGANPANLLILLVDGLTVYSSSLSFNNGLFNTSSPWTSFTVSSPPVFSTNGKYAYLSWLSNGNIVGRQYKTSWQSPVTLFSNSGGNYTSFASTVNPTDDLVLMMIRNQQTSNNKQACYGKRYYSGSSSPVTVLESGMPYGNYTAWSVSVEGNKTLASIGKSPDGESWNYYLWKNDGTSWTKETSPFSATPARLLHNEVDEYPVEATIQPDSVTNLYALKTNPVTWPTGGAGMAKDGDEAEGFSIVASRLGDTTETWITIDPASVDSIVIDTLMVWSIALKQESIRDYLISQLNRVGSASYTDSSATIRFVPSGARYTFYVVDPSGNKFRIRKSSLDAEEEGEPVLSATVSVFPNPFNPVTVLSVTMPEAGHARLTIYNILGQQVASLVNGQLNAGVHDLRFNASNLSSGTYLYRFEAGKVAKTGKLQLMK